MKSTHEIYTPGLQPDGVTFNQPIAADTYLAHLVGSSASSYLGGPGGLYLDTQTFGTTRIPSPIPVLLSAFTFDVQELNTCIDDIVQQITDNTGAIFEWWVRGVKGGKPAIVIQPQQNPTRLAVQGQPMIGGGGVNLIDNPTMAADSSFTGSYTGVALNWTYAGYDNISFWVDHTSSPGILKMDPGGPDDVTSSHETTGPLCAYSATLSVVNGRTYSFQVTCNLDESNDGAANFGLCAVADKTVNNSAPSEVYTSQAVARHGNPPTDQTFVWQATFTGDAVFAIWGNNITGSAAFLNPSLITADYITGYTSQPHVTNLFSPTQTKTTDYLPVYKDITIYDYKIQNSSRQLINLISLYGGPDPATNNQQPMFGVFKDSTSIALYGVRIKKVTNSSLFSTDALAAYASVYILLNGYPQPQGSFYMFAAQDFARAGQYFQIAEPGLQGNEMLYLQAAADHGAFGTSAIDPNNPNQGLEPTFTDQFGATIYIPNQLELDAAHVTREDPFSTIDPTVLNRDYLLSPTHPHKVKQVRAIKVITSFGYAGTGDRVTQQVFVSAPRPFIDLAVYGSINSSTSYRAINRTHAGDTVSLSRYIVSGGDYLGPGTGYAPLLSVRFSIPTGLFGDGKPKIQLDSGTWTFYASSYFGQYIHTANTSLEIPLRDPVIASNANSAIAAQATGDGTYDVVFVNNELHVFGVGNEGPALHVSKLGNARQLVTSLDYTAASNVLSVISPQVPGNHFPLPYHCGVLVLRQFTVVNGVITGNREKRVMGGAAADGSITSGSGVVTDSTSTFSA